MNLMANTNSPNRGVAKISHREVAQISHRRGKWLLLATEYGGVVENWPKVEVVKISCRVAWLKLATGGVDKISHRGWPDFASFID